MTYLNFLAIEKASQNQIPLSTHPPLPTCSLLSLPLALAHKGVHMHHILRFLRVKKQSSMKSFWCIKYKKELKENYKFYRNLLLVS